MKQKKSENDDVNCVAANIEPKVKHDELYGRNIDNEHNEKDSDNTIKVHTYKINNKYSSAKVLWEKMKEICKKFI